MPHFSIQIGLSGPLFDAWVGVSQARQDALKSANQPIPPLEKVRALLDTGASCTCIDPSVLTALGISPTGTTQMNTPSTGDKPQDVNTYDVSIYIVGATPPPLSLRTVAVAETLLLKQQGFHALIGRDILEAFVIHYNGPLKYITLSF